MNRAALLVAYSNAEHQLRMAEAHVEQAIDLLLEADSQGAIEHHVAEGALTDLQLKLLNVTDFAGYLGRASSVVARSMDIAASRSYVPEPAAA